MDNYNQGVGSPQQPPSLGHGETSFNLDEDLLMPLQDDGGEDDIDFNGIDEDLKRFQKDDLVQQALSQGVDLRGYSREIEAELREVEMDSVREYVSQSDKVLELHNEIKGCDTILARMQEMLLGFQADLGGISDEIRHLQDESISLNIKLKNRRVAEDQLSKFLSNVIIHPDLATAICNDEVNDAYMYHISVLNTKIKYVCQGSAPQDGSTLDVAPNDTMTGREVRPHLEKLRAKACARAREYLMSRISELRRPKTNVQIIQKNSLLKYKYLVQFISDNAPETAEEVRSVYIESMGRTIHNLFRAYHAQLAKLEIEVATKHDLIAVEELAARGMFGAKVDLTKRGDAFSLGDRDKILDQVEAEPVLVHVVQAEATRFPYEVIMRSVLKHLVDSATSEYLFTLEFFRGKGHDTFNRIFERTLTLCVENMETYLFGSHDAIGILIMIKLLHSHRLVMQRRRIPILDVFFDRLNMMLWPKLKAIFDANLKSITKADIKKLGIIDCTSHYVTKRYAEYAASLLALHSGLDHTALGIGGEEMLLNDLATLRVEMVKFIKRLSATLATKKLQVVFLINNYDQVLTVFQERRIMADETTKFDELLAEEREHFVEEELRERYMRLISFVQSNESVAEGGRIEEDVAEVLVRDFAATWKSGLEAINQDVLSYFANSRNGMEILKQVLTQLLLYYTRFQEIIRRHWRKPPPFTKDLVSTAAILAEIKKYSTFYAS